MNIDLTRFSFKFFCVSQIELLKFSRGFWKSLTILKSTGMEQGLCGQSATFMTVPKPRTCQPKQFFHTKNIARSWLQSWRFKKTTFSQCCRSQRFEDSLDGVSMMLKDSLHFFLPQNWELMNTAVLTGRQVSQVMKVFIVTQAGKVADVTLQSSCHAEDESVIKVSVCCSFCLHPHSFASLFPFVVVMDDEFLIRLEHPVTCLIVSLLVSGFGWLRIHLVLFAIEIIELHA